MGLFDKLSELRSKTKKFSPSAQAFKGTRTGDFLGAQRDPLPPKETRQIPNIDTNQNQQSFSPMSTDKIPEGIFDPVNFQMPEQTGQAFTNKSRLSDFAFDPSSVMQSPAAKLRLAEAQKAIENSAAARGNVFSGGTLSALQDRSQQIASDEFGNEFNRQLASYGINKDASNDNFNRDLTRFQTGRTTDQDAIERNLLGFNTRRTTQGDVFNRLASIAGLGQTSVGQLQGGFQNAGNNIAQLQSNTGLANAQGIQGMNNAFQGGLNNLAFMLYGRQ